MTETEQVTVPLPGGERMSALLVHRSADRPSGPAVMLIHDILGISDDTARIATRFADEGYTVLAPDYFGPGLMLPCVARAALSLRRGRGPHFERLRAAHDRLAAMPEVDRDRIGVVGFCIGGGFAVLWAARSDTHAVATFYGDVPATAEQLRGIPPCVAGYGGRDRVFAAQGRRLRDHLTALGVEHDVREYPGVGHAYMNQHRGLVARAGAHSPLSARFDPEAAADSWQRMLRFFADHLG